MKWEIGDIAICIHAGNINSNKGRNPPLRKNVEYIVNNVRTCECGGISLDVGILLHEDSIGVGCNCGANSSPKSGIWWCAASRFTKKQALVDSIIESALKETEIIN